MDTVLLALVAGFLLALFMRYDTTLFEATRSRCTWLEIGYAVVIVVLAGVEECAWVLNFVNLANSCPPIVIARENLSTEVLGINLPNQIGAISGSVGFVLATSKTRSKKWLGVGVLLVIIFPLIVYKMVWPT